MKKNYFITNKYLCLKNYEIISKENKKLIGIFLISIFKSFFSMNFHFFADEYSRSLLVLKFKKKILSKIMLSKIIRNTKVLSHI